MKDLNYFIREAKDEMRKKMQFEDFLDVIANAKADERQELTEVWQKGESLLPGVGIGMLIDEYIDSQTETILEKATEAYQEYQEDRKAEAYEQRYLARIGA